jgi:excinuclease UvrABC nuclease subunit
MSQGNWSRFYPYTTQCIDKYVKIQPGNYRLCRSSDVGYYVFYVGKSDTDLNRRLKEHLSQSETNDCIKNKLQKHTCYFQFIYVTTLKERDEIESNDIKKYNPPCNKQS